MSNNKKIKKNSGVTNGYFERDARGKQTSGDQYK